MIMFRKILLFVPFICIAAFAVLVFVGMQRADPDAIPSVQIGKPAPDVQLTPFPGQTGFTNADFAAGQITFVNFWASWCAPCRAEHPNLVALSEAGFNVFGVNYKNDPEDAQRFLDELGNPYAKGGADPNAQMALQWGVYGLPETFVIGPDGKVILRVAGPLTQRNIQDRVIPALQDAGVDPGSINLVFD